MIPTCLHPYQRRSLSRVPLLSLCHCEGYSASVISALRSFPRPRVLRTWMISYDRSCYLRSTTTSALRRRLIASVTNTVQVGAYYYVLGFSTLQLPFRDSCPPRSICFYFCTGHTFLVFRMIFLRFHFVIVVQCTLFFVLTFF